MVAPAMLVGAVPASAGAPLQGWYVEADAKGRFARVAIYAEGSRLRVANLGGGRGRCVDRRGRRSRFPGLMPEPAWDVRVRANGSFKAARAKNRRGDRYRESIRGRVEGMRVRGTYRRRTYWTAQGRDPAIYPEICRGSNRFNAQLVWPHGVPYTGLTSQGRPVTLLTGTARDRDDSRDWENSRLPHPRHQIPGAARLPLKDFGEVPVRRLQTTVVLACDDGTSVERTIDIGPTASGWGQRTIILTADPRRFLFEGDGDDLSLKASVAGLSASGQVTMTRSERWPGEKYFDGEDWEIDVKARYCQSGDVSFTAAYGVPGR
jgi:hypothetical protein